MAYASSPSSQLAWRRYPTLHPSHPQSLFKRDLYTLELYIDPLRLRATVPGAPDFPCTPPVVSPGSEVPRVVRRSTVTCSPSVGLITHNSVGRVSRFELALSPVGPCPCRPNLTCFANGVEASIAARSAPLFAAPASIRCTRLPQSASVGDRSCELSSSMACAVGAAAPCTVCVGC